MRKCAPKPQVGEVGWDGCPGPGKPLGKAVRLSRSSQHSGLSLGSLALHNMENSNPESSAWREGAALCGWQQGAWEPDQHISASWDPASPSTDTGSPCE